jgi:hypothetical protein
MGNCDKEEGIAKKENILTERRIKKTGENVAYVRLSHRSV